MALLNVGPLDGLKREFATLDHPIWIEISKHFGSDEFEKPEKMDVNFLRVMFKARKLAGVPFRIINTLRDDSRSAHGEVPGIAVDLQVLNSYERSRVVRSAYAVGFIRVGVYMGTDGKYKGLRKRDGGGVHLDASSVKPQDHLWTMKIRKATN